MAEKGKIFYKDTWVEMEYELKEGKMYLTDMGLVKLMNEIAAVVADKYLLALNSTVPVNHPIADVHSAIASDPASPAPVAVASTVPEPVQEHKSTLPGGWTVEKQNVMRKLMNDLKIKNKDEFNPYVQRWLGFPKDRVYTWKDVTPDRVEEFVAFIQELLS